jgi:hypothetical protein
MRYLHSTKALKISKIVIQISNIAIKIYNKYDEYTKAGYEWFTSSEKVSQDMKRAGCPYQ